MESLGKGPDIKELLKMGRDSAAELKALLEENGSGPAQNLVGKILRSLDGVLTGIVSNHSTSDEDMEMAAGSPSSGDRSYVDSGESGNKTPIKERRRGYTRRTTVKDRRGGYKRRRASGSHIQVSTTLKDGYTWRKYGQKVILNAKHPRCYYRCTHKADQGCLANKQVQIIAEDPKMYQTTYFGHHTCTNDAIKPSNFVFNSNLEDPHMFTLKLKNEISLSENNYDSTSVKILTPPNREEIKERISIDPTVDMTRLMFWTDNLREYNEGVIPELYYSGCSTSSYGDWSLEFLKECDDFDNAFTS